MQLRGLLNISPHYAKVHKMGWQYIDLPEDLLQQSNKDHIKDFIYSPSKSMRPYAMNGFELEPREFDPNGLGPNIFIVDNDDDVV